MTPTAAPPPAPEGSPFDPALAEAGRIPALLVLWGLFVLSTTPFLGRLLQGETANLAQNVLYTVATAALLVQVWRGSVWAWRLTVAFSIFTGVLIFVVGMLTGVSAWIGWLVSAAGIAYVLLACCLLAVPTIRAFLDERWAARRPRGGAAGRSA
ncbi:hypothetical protein [Deinococcus hohokamensis]|uniref:Uncharacterized protein n=1 Tax=Deinococcus hohokamensis TaxID=309883 RepID=A0ABV9ICH5_9DEIO